MEPENVETRYFILQPCRTSAAYEAFPRRKLRLRLSDVASRLPEAGIQVVHDAGILLLVRGACEASVYESGKLLLKTTDKALALSEAERILTALGVEPAQ